MCCAACTARSTRSWRSRSNSARNRAPMVDPAGQGGDGIELWLTNGRQWVAPRRARAVRSGHGARHSQDHMKRTERHHLKENELRTFARHAAGAVEARGRETTMILGAVVVVIAVAIGYFAWRERVQGKARALLADAMTVAEARIGPPPAPGTPAGGLYFPTERERAQAALTKFKVA